MFKDNLLHLNQDETFVSSALRVLINSFRFVWDNTIFVSSANKTKAKTVDELTMSLIYIKNSNGPNIEPCGTPHLIFKREDSTLSDRYKLLTI